jgi:phosphoribosylanthranilate isomerase
MRTRVKICCIANLDEAKLAIDGGADALGFVGRMQTGDRQIPDEQIAAIAAQIPPPIAAFLLTSEHTAEGIAAHVRRTGVSTVQIVSHLEPEQSRGVAELLPSVRRVQVIHVEDRKALELIEVYAAHVHAFILDSGRPSAAVPEFGGTGRTHDWDISREFVQASPRPIFLAGGLTPMNVERAIRYVRPFGVDLCTGVRTSGRLDPARLAAFVSAVRAAERIE